MLIDSGPLRMGRLPGQELCRTNRRGVNNEPAHPVVLEAPFAMSRTEITVGEFELFVQSTGDVTSAERSRRAEALPACARSRRGLRPQFLLGPFAAAGGDRGELANPGYPPGPNHPVVCLNRVDASAYAAWLAEETGLPHGVAYGTASERRWRYRPRRQ